MSTDNNGMFDKIRKSMATRQREDLVGRETDPKAPLFDRQSDDLQQELLQHLAQEKANLKADLEDKYKQATLKRIQVEGEKLKEQFEVEKQKQQQLIKQKYQQAAKSMLQQKVEELSAQQQTQLKQSEQALTKKFQETLQQHQEHFAKIESELSKKVADLQHQLSQKQQELQQQQQTSQISIGEAKINARQEQEKSSRALYEDLMQANQAELMRQMEQKYNTQLLNLENELKLEHTSHLKQQGMILMQDYETKLKAALIAQEHELNQKYAEQLAKQSDLFDLRVQQEVTAAIAIASKAQDAEFAKQRFAMQAEIDHLRPDIEANKQRYRAEVEEALRVEYEFKLSQFKLDLENAKHEEIAGALAAEKQRQSEALQEENLIVLKYKEREIRDLCEADKLQALMDLRQEHEATMQVNLDKALAEQEQKLRDEHMQKVKEITSNLISEYNDKIQIAVIQERSRSNEQTTTEKKILLQQLEANLQNRFNSEKIELLQQQEANMLAAFDMEKSTLLQKVSNLEEQLENESRLSASRQAVAIQELELKLAAAKEEVAKMTAEHESELQSKIAAAVATREQELLNSLNAQKFAESNLAAPTTVMLGKSSVGFEQEKLAALREQEKVMHAKYATELQQKILECEQNLRREFQAILIEQRKQAAANYSKQRESDIRAAISKYKQRILKDVEVARVNDVAATEAALKEQFSAKIQQQTDILRAELENSKQQLQAEYHEKINAAVAEQKELLQDQYAAELAKVSREQEEKVVALIEEERKKFNKRFAQDKATLIKDLTEKFTREKHIAMDKYETELRDKLYGEMVKQKDYIQQKFASAQEAALQEQRRRLEAQHKHEVDRIKKGYFEPSQNHAQHEQIIAERSVEMLADRILAKFNTKDN